MTAKFVFLSAFFLSLGLAAQTGSITGFGSDSTSTKDFGQVVKKSSVVRVVDQELGNVCYVAHGVSNDSGAAITCMKLEKK